MKSGNAFGKSLQSTGEKIHSLKIPDAVVAFAQAAAKANDLPGWPLMSPAKIPMQKCDKCSREIFAHLNHRRHIRMHRRPLSVDKDDLRKERPHIAAFWDKLTLDNAMHMLNYKDLSLEDLSGASVVRTLPHLIQQQQQQPSLASLPHPYLKAGNALLEIVENKPCRFPLCSEELFSILDDASENSFLFGSTSTSVQKFMFEGDEEKTGLESQNLIASLAFLVELKLVNCWMAAKDADALRCLNELVEEEEAAEKKRARIQEKKRLKKLRQKEQKDKERKAIDDISLTNSGQEVLEGSSMAMPSMNELSQLPSPIDSNIGADKEENLPMVSEEHFELSTKTTESSHWEAAETMDSHQSSSYMVEHPYSWRERVRNDRNGHSAYHRPVQGGDRRFLGANHQNQGAGQKPGMTKFSRPWEKASGPVWARKAQQTSLVLLETGNEENCSREQAEDESRASGVVVEISGNENMDGARRLSRNSSFLFDAGSSHSSTSIEEPKCDSHINVISDSLIPYANPKQSDVDLLESTSGSVYIGTLRIPLGNIPLPVPAQEVKHVQSELASDVASEEGRLRLVEDHEKAGKPEKPESWVIGMKKPAIRGSGVEISQVREHGVDSHKITETQDSSLAGSDDMDKVESNNTELEGAVFALQFGGSDGQNCESFESSEVQQFSILQLHSDSFSVMARKFLSQRWDEAIAEACGD